MAPRRHSTADHRAPPTWLLMRKAQWAVVIVLVAVSEIVFLNGQTVLSYVIDAVAVAAFFWIRKLRQLRSE